MEKVKVLFVCMGNICRSPTAEGVFAKIITDKHLTGSFEHDSAGTHDYHIGKPPDERAQHAAKGRGVELAHLRARQIHSSDYEYFDYILVMDSENHALVMAGCPPEYRHKVKYFLEFAPHLNIKEVPDPYFGGQQGFERVLDMVEAACLGFLQKLQADGKITLK